MFTFEGLNSGENKGYETGSFTHSTVLRPSYISLMDYKMENQIINFYHFSCKKILQNLATLDEPRQDLPSPFIEHSPNALTNADVGYKEEMLLKG